MRSIIHVDAAVLAEIQRLAEMRGISVEVMVEQALSELLARYVPNPSASAPAELPTFGGTGVRPGVNLDKMSSLLDVMEHDDSC